MPEPNAILSSGANTKLLGLDHLRAFAIAYVIFFHYQFFGHPSWVNKIAGFGWSGVDLFFVLSGFLISGQLFAAIARGQQVSLNAFFIKRFFRIIPPFLVVVVLYTALPATHEWGHLSPIWRYLSFTLNFGLNLREYGTFSHAWSLCVEEQFYLVLPLMFLLFNYFHAGAKAVYLLILLFIGGFFIRLWSWQHFIEPVLNTDDYGAFWNEYIYYPTYNRLDSLLIGVAVAGIYTFYPTIMGRINSYANVILAAGIVLLIASGFVCKGYSTFATTLWGFPLAGLSYGLVLTAVVCPSSLVYHFQSFITGWLATLSYAIYLSHKIVIHVIQNWFGSVGVDRNSNLMMLISMAGVIAFALLMRYAIEMPALKLRNKILAQLNSAISRRKIKTE